MRTDSIEKNESVKSSPRTKKGAGKGPAEKKTNDSKEKRRGLRPGRRVITGGKRGPDKGEAKTIQLKIDPEVFKNIRDLLKQDDPARVERILGFEFDRDLLIHWPGPEKGHKKSQSGRTACILEALARRGREIHEKI